MRLGTCVSGSGGCADKDTKRIPSIGQLTLVSDWKGAAILDACSRKCSTTLAQNDHSTLTRNVAFHETLY